MNGPDTDDRAKGGGQDHGHGPEREPVDAPEYRTDKGAAQGQGQGPDAEPAAMRDVLASIRELVSSEASARMGARGDTGSDQVLMLTPDLRIEPDVEDGHAGEVLTEGIGGDGFGRVQPAPILDEEALRGVINSLVREELQGELGDRIARNLRKLIRRELGQMLDERRSSGERIGSGASTGGLDRPTPDQP